MKKYLKSKYGFKTTAELKAALSASDLICIAYLKSMDNYFDTKEALTFATAAQAKEPKSYTINIIRSLIKKNLHERLKKRKSLNRYDRFNMTFYNKVQNGFMKLSKLKKNKYELINSNLDIKNNEKLILNIIDKLI